MTLPVTVNFHSDETRMSLLSRLAIANGYSCLGEFLAFTNTNAHAVRSGAPEAIAMLADWSGIEPQLLQSYNVKSKGYSTWTLGAASMSKDMRLGRSHRYCPKCVMEDMERDSGRPFTRPYVRVTWMTRATQACLVHGCEIVGAPAIGLDADDFARFAEGNLPAIKQQARTVLKVGSMQVDAYVAARIEDKKTNPFLDGLETYVAVDLCRNLGYFEQQHRPKGQKTSTSLSAVETGFVHASQGAQQIEAFIAATIERVKPLALEMSVFFGKLRSWLLRHGPKPELSPVVELFQGIAERHLPIGKDDHFILPTRQRHLHSVRSAMIEYNLPEDRIYQLVVEAGLVQPSKVPSGRVYFNAEQAHEVLSAAVETMTTVDLAKAIGVHLDRTRAILDAGLIPRVEKSSKNNARVYSRIRPADYEAFRAKLQAPEASSSERERIQTFTQVSKLAACTIEEIIALALDGKLTSLRRINTDSLINGLGVDPIEVCTYTRAKRAAARVVGETANETLGLIGIKRVREQLKTRGKTVSELVRLGYIRLIEGRNPSTGLRQDYVCVRSLEEFRKAHVSLAELSARSKMFRATLGKDLDARGIKPIFEITGGGARYYRLEDVRHIIG